MKVFSQILGIFLLISLLSCAKEGFPPGGPEDKTPPVVVRTIPNQGEVRVDSKARIIIEFSEPVRPAQAEDAIFISPFPGENISYKWRGKNLVIRFPEPLLEKQTYVISLGTAIRDYRNNPLESSYSLAFSTGDSLDQGEIAGRVVSDKSMRGVDIWAYKLEDEPDPAKVSPDYAVQCDQSGQFRLTNLAPAGYRLFAVRDRYADRIYQPGEDELGVTWSDVIIESPLNMVVKGVLFTLGLRDTLAPSVTRIQTEHQRALSIQFDESILTTAHSLSKSFHLSMKSDTASTLKIESAYIDPQKENLVHLQTAPMQSDSLYLCLIDSIEDRSGHALDTLYRISDFRGTASPDTTEPALLYSYPAHRSNNFFPNEPVRLMFPEAMDTLICGAQVTDTLENEVPGIWKWVSIAECRFIPAMDLKSRTNYRICLDSLSFFDRTGIGIHDTTIQFTTINRDTLTEISGFVEDKKVSARGSIHITARLLGKETLIRETVIPEPGHYILSDLLPGHYILQCYRDRDGNSTYSEGHPFPFIPAERFTAYLDTIMCRSRWPNEGNDLSLP